MSNKPTSGTVFMLVVVDIGVNAVCESGLFKLVVGKFVVEGFRFLGAGVGLLKQLEVVLVCTLLAGGALL